MKKNIKSVQEIHQILMQQHEIKEKDRQKTLEKTKTIIYNQKKKKLLVKNNKLKIGRSKKNKDASYMQINKNQEDYIKQKNSRITWEQIQNNDYDHFMLNNRISQERDNNKEINQVFEDDISAIELEDQEYMGHLLNNPNSNFVPAIKHKFNN